ncbi:MAG: hypothetical protein V1911_02890 [Candidatus Micrarchaeota archaeon]
MKLKIALLLIVCMSAGLATAPQITPPVNGGYDTDGSITLQWSGGSHSYFKIFENGVRISEENCYDSTSVSLERQNGQYIYYIQGFDDEFCAFGQEDSPTITITVDTTAPTVVSKTPTGTEKATSGSIAITFSETMNKAQTSAAASGLALGTAAWSNSDKTVTYAYSGALSGTSYAVSVSGKDLATNPVSDSFSFTTVSAPKTVSIVNPLAGASYTQGDSIPITVNVKDNSNLAVAGAAVSASGCSSAVAFSDKLNGTYTGTCTVSNYGSVTISVTAAKHGESATGQVAVSVAKQAGLIMAVTAPAVFSYERGDTVNFVISLEDDNGAAVAGASVTSTPSLSWVDNGDGTYSAVLQTGAETAASVSLAITATAVVSGQTKTASQTVALSFGAVAIPLTVQILSDGEEAAVAPAGSAITVRAAPSFASGTSLVSLTGTLVISDIAGNTQTKTLTFEQSGDGYIADPDYTVASGVSSLEATVSVTDSANNTGTETASINGPVAGLSFEILSPDGWTYGAGQSFVIQGKVKSGSTGQYVSDAAVSIDGEEFEQSGDVFSYNYTVPDAASGVIDLDIRMEYGGVVSEQTKKLTISKVLTGEINDAKIQGDILAVLITYPNGEAVKYGNFTAVVGNHNYTLAYLNGLWKADVNLGEDEKSVVVSVTGTDVNGNALSMVGQTTSYVPAKDIIYLVKSNLILIAVIIMAVIGAIAYHKMTARDKDVKKYIELGVEKKEIEEKQKILQKQVVFRDKLPMLLSQKEVQAIINKRKEIYDSKKIDITEEMNKIEIRRAFPKNLKAEFETEIIKQAEILQEKMHETAKREYQADAYLTITEKMRQGGQKDVEIEQFLKKELDSETAELVMQELFSKERLQQRAEKLRGEIKSQKNEEFKPPSDKELRAANDLKEALKTESPEQVKQELKDNGVSDETIERLFKIIDGYT